MHIFDQLYEYLRKNKQNIKMCDQSKQKDLILLVTVTHYKEPLLWSHVK